MRVHSCAGYVSGDDGSNTCPDGYARIETEAACRTAAVAAGKTFNSGAENLGSYPKGCYYFARVNGAAVFNAHAQGAGKTGTQLLCAVAAVATVATGARSPCSHACVRPWRIYRACLHGTV